MRTFIILLLAGAFAACSVQRQPACPPASIVVKDSVVHDVDTQYISQVVEIPGDQVTIYDSLYLPCPEWETFNYSRKAISATGRTTATVSITRGRLTVDCEADSLKKVIDSMVLITDRLQQYQRTTITVDRPVTVFKKVVPKWCWYLLIFNLVYFGFKFRSPILKLLGK